MCSVPRRRRRELKVRTFIAAQLGSDGSGTTHALDLPLADMYDGSGGRYLGTLMTMLSASPIPMKFSVRADLFGQLAAMEDAGLPFDRVLEILHLPPNEEARRHAMRKWIRRGLGIADAGARSGLFTALEASLVRAATSSGSPARTYRLIANQCERRAARIKAMKSRMALPALIIAISIILGPVPNLISGSLTLAAYLAKYLLPWIGVAVTLYLLRDFLRRQPRSAHSFWMIRLHGVLAFVPLFGPMEVRRNLRDFYGGLALLLEAGVAILEALPWRWTRSVTRRSDLDLPGSNR